jgi:hypothetical protein
LGQNRSGDLVAHAGWTLTGDNASLSGGSWTADAANLASTQRARCSRGTRLRLNYLVLRQPLSDHDLCCPLLSLAERFATTPATIPVDIPYLSADPALVERWRGKLPSGFKVGLAWAGNPNQPNDRHRSMAVETLRPLLDTPGVRWFSVQVGDRAPDVARLESGSISDLSPQLRDFAETAAVMENLDLIVTIDTAVAHLAGALGRPVWVMVPALSDWRYPPGSDSNIWYPTMRLFRQSVLGQWKPVIEKLRQELENAVRHSMMQEKVAVR